MAFRVRDITALSDDERDAIVHLFEDFEHTLGPVGAAKALHLLAPHVFPLWDRAIAAAYRLPLGPKGTNGLRYWRFVQVVKEQVPRLGSLAASGCNPLKLLDECNYGRFTTHWL